MNKQTFKPGDRVRTLVPSLTEWMGTGTVFEVRGNVVSFAKDGPFHDEALATHAAGELVRGYEKSGLYAAKHLALEDPPL